MTPIIFALDCRTKAALRRVNPGDMANDPNSGKPQAVPENRNLSMRENRLDSREIFVGTREITIAHGEELYRLRLTAQNKLILTK